MSEALLWTVLALGAGIALFGVLGGGNELPVAGPVGDGNDHGQDDGHDEPGPSPGGSQHVEMQNIQFEPARLVVPAGTTVVWTNHDPFQHTVSAVDPAQWGTAGSDDEPTEWLDEGASWSFRFDERGTYVYYCLPHASKSDDGTYRGMVGTVVVGGAGGDPSPPPVPVPTTTVVPDPVAPQLMLPGPDGIVRI